MKKTKVFISKLLLSIITISLSWQASLGLAIQCKEPELSSEKIIAIIQQERTARTDLPEKFLIALKKFPVMIVVIIYIKNTQNMFQKILSFLY